ncbi:MFS transporter [Komagataeibacter sp. FXV2]|nr:MFS transporter [Komagataeibacter sp. FXV2]
MDQSRPVPGFRWRIGCLLALGVFVNYIDRIALSVASPQIQGEYGLTNIQLGWLFSGFFWVYAFAQIPSGLLADRFGARATMRLSTILWTVSSGLMALAQGFPGFFAARMLLGLAEAPAYPAGTKATGYWFPRSERGTATAVFDASARFANVVGVPLVALVAVHLGWRWSFVMTACFSLCYAVAFFLGYRDPSRHPRLTAQEHRYILAGGACAEGTATAGSGWATIPHLLRQRKIWGIILGFAAYGYFFTLFLTWMPNYLVRELHVSMMQSAIYVMIPWGVATLGELFVGGWLIDALCRRGYDDTWTRKAMLMLGFMLGMAMIGAIFTHRPGWAVFWISISLGGLSSAAPIIWSLPSLVAPRGVGGTVTGIANFVNNGAGIIATVLTGYLVSLTGSFGAAFLCASVMLLAGFVAIAILVESFTPVGEPPACGIAVPLSGLAEDRPVKS